MEVVVTIKAKGGGDLACRAWATKVLFWLLAERTTKESGFGLVKPGADRQVRKFPRREGG